MASVYKWSIMDVVYMDDSTVLHSLPLGPSRQMGNRLDRWTMASVENLLYCQVHRVVSSSTKSSYQVVGYQQCSQGPKPRPIILKI